MGFARVEISGAFLTDWITQGWHSKSLECIKGLPEGAVFQCSEYIPGRGVVWLVYSHESFECPAIHLLYKTDPIYVEYRSWHLTDKEWAALKGGVLT